MPSDKFVAYTINMFENIGVRLNERRELKCENLDITREGDRIMKYLEYDLGYQTAGKVAQVILSGTEANVMLLDSVNLSNYRNGRKFSYFGGHYTSSPALIRIPSDGNWYVVVDLGGGAGTVNASVAVLP